jgi:hypothetical protein
MVLRRLFRKLLGYNECPICHEQTVQWVKDPILFEDEPPLLGHWQCFNTDCLVRTETESTAWADKIANEFGYSTYKKALEELARKE